MRGFIVSLVFMGALIWSSPVSAQDSRGHTSVNSTQTQTKGKAGSSVKEIPWQVRKSVGTKKSPDIVKGPAVINDHVLVNRDTTVKGGLHVGQNGSFHLKGANLTVDGPLVIDGNMTIGGPPANSEPAKGKTIMMPGSDCKPGQAKDKR